MHKFSIVLSRETDKTRQEYAVRSESFCKLSPSVHFCFAPFLNKNVDSCSRYSQTRTLDYHVQWEIPIRSGEWNYLEGQVQNEIGIRSIEQQSNSKKRCFTFRDIRISVSGNGFSLHGIIYRIDERLFATHYENYVAIFNSASIKLSNDTKQFGTFSIGNICVQISLNVERGLNVDSNDTLFQRTNVHRCLESDESKLFAVRIKGRRNSQR